MARDPRKGSAYGSGMRGSEKPSGGGSKQGPKTKVGNPDGEGSASGSAYSSGMRGAEKPAAPEALKMGGPGQNLEAAANGQEPSGNGILGQEDDTHMHFSIPKSAIKRKTPGMPA